MRKSHERIGKIYWCRNCNVPLLGNVCGICGKSGEKIVLHHGVEIRPGFEYTVERINGLIEKIYGVRDALKGKLVLLHKIAGIDRTEEIIVDGMPFATIAYIPENKEFRINLKGYGAAYLRHLGAVRNIIVVSKEALKRHLKNRWLHRSEIIEKKEFVQAYDTILCIGDYTGVGISRFSDGTEIPEKCVRVREIGRWNICTKKSTIEMALRANVRYLKKLEAQAVSDIKRNLGHSDKVYISFSGGKDSTVVLHLLKRCTDRFEILFVDTGLEYPETREFVENTCGNRVHVLKPDKSFWELVEKMGPPAKDYRWCCKVCKLAPVSKFVETHGNIVCFEGRRKGESFSRAGIGLIEHNPFVPGQILVNPIRNWSALDVWLYILWHRIPVNPLYLMDYERIGCFMCPAEHACEFDELAHIHPEMYSRWLNLLKTWSEKNGLGREYWEKGQWRWVVPPRKIQSEERTREVHDVKLNESETCGGEIVFEGNVGMIFQNLCEVANALGILGEVRYIEESGVVSVATGKVRVMFFASGELTVRGRERETMRSIVIRVLQQLLRMKFCTSCGICVRACPAKALEIINNKPHVLLDRCRKCGRCIDACVIARYWDKHVQIVYT